MAAKNSERKMNISLYKQKTKKKRNGVHSKKKTSSLKSSKNYKKTYKGQG